MTMVDIKAGESNIVEFKSQIPEKSIKYMKSVVAFSNGTGGKIIFGIDDDRKVLGIEEDTVFRAMDSIANAISDSCEPAIIPDIYLQTMDDKTVIVVEISAGKQRPYFIKTQGREQGVYVRVAGTTRPADDMMIKELLFEGSNRSFDQTICLGMNITDIEIEDLCKSMQEIAMLNSGGEPVKPVTKRQLLSWGIIIEKDGGFFPTNAFAILTGCWNTRIQCAVFKGVTKSVFIDRKEFDGPIHDQLEQAFLFVLRHINLGATFDGLYRVDEYEIPKDVIRELIINAVVHRSYLDRHNIQIAVYDDRLEVTSPGKLILGQTIDKMKEGYSKIRNEGLAYAFSYMRLIEHWGSGIPRIIARLKECGLKEPTFIGGDTELRINVYREPNKAVDLNHVLNDPGKEYSDLNHDLDDLEKEDFDLNRDLNDQEKHLLKLIGLDSRKTMKQYAEMMGISDSTVKRILTRLQNDGMIIREGSRRKSNWIVKQ